MDIDAIIKGTPKGANIVCVWERDVKVKKAYAGIPLRKQTRMVGRIGIEYDNINAVQQKRENGELPATNAGLQSWQEWVTYPYLLQHNVNGTQYLRLYTGTSKKVRPFVKFMLDGQLVSKDQIAHMLLSNELTSSKGDCFMVKVNDLIRIHDEGAEIAAESAEIAHTATEDSNA